MCGSSSTVAESQSGRYPNPGPLALVRGGVKLVDAPGAELFEQVSDGEKLDGSRRRHLSQRHVPRLGSVLEAGGARRELIAQQGRVTEALEAFAENTMRYLRDEGRLLSEGATYRCSRRPSAIGMRSSSREGPG